MVTNPVGAEFLYDPAQYKTKPEELKVALKGAAAGEFGSDRSQRMQRARRLLHCPGRIHSLFMNHEIFRQTFLQSSNQIERYREIGAATLSACPRTRSTTRTRSDETAGPTDHEFSKSR